MGPRRIRRSVAAGVAVALLSAGCGGSGSASTAGGRPGDPLLKLAECMRAHGVTHFPDPTPGGGLAIPNGMNAQAPAFQAAQRACNRLLPGGAPGSKPSEAARLAMVRMARCIRAHGVPDFADPTTAPPASPPARGLAIGRGGMFLVVRDAQAPAFRRAAAACGFPLPH
jgi:hypothetical protein